MHNKLIEYLNNEIVLRTVTNINIAINWLKSTYLYIRLKKNPSYYGAKKFLNEADVESYLKSMLKLALTTYHLIIINFRLMQ